MDDANGRDTHVRNPLRAALRAGRTVTGIICFTGSPMLVEVMAAARVDFVLLDMEHSPLDLDGAAHCIRAAAAYGITPLVRIPGVDPALIKKLLNLGAAGIALPHADREGCTQLLERGALCAGGKPRSVSDGPRRGVRAPRLERVRGGGEP